MPIPESCRRLLLAAVVGVLLPPMPGLAQSLFGRHQVTLEFATADGKKLADAEVRVFAPGQPGKPALTGRTDSAGRFEFSADRDGFWSAEARVGDEIARIMVRVGGKEESNEPPSPYWLLGGLMVMLVLAFAYRVARNRSRRRPPPNRPGPPPQSA